METGFRRCPSRFLLGSLLFLVYINDLPNELKSNAKLFADDTSLFTIVKDKQKNADVLNHDQSLISEWAFNWEMLINSDANKPAQEVLFSRKKETQNDPNASLINIQVERVSHRKHLGIIIDEKLNFKEHINSTILKVNRGLAVLKKLRYSLPWKSLIRICKALLRPLLDYGDITYDQPHNESVCEKLESVQYKVALAITGAIQGNNFAKTIYQELVLESLRARRRCKRLSCMFKIVKEEATSYFINFIRKVQQITRTRINRMPGFHCLTDCFKNSFFPSTLNDRDKFNETVRNSEPISIFKSRLLSFIRPLEGIVFNIFHPIGLKFLTRLRLGFSHLNEHRFQHSFEIEDTLQHLLHCHHFSQHCIDLMNSVKSILEYFESLSDNVKKDVLLYGESSPDGNRNNFILQATLTYIKGTDRFSGSTFD